LSKCTTVANNFKFCFIPQTLSQLRNDQVQPLPRANVSRIYNPKVRIGRAIYKAIRRREKYIVNAVGKHRIVSAGIALLEIRQEARRNEIDLLRTLYRPRLEQSEET